MTCFLSHPYDLWILYKHHSKIKTNTLKTNLGIVMIPKYFDDRLVIVFAVR